MAGGIQQSQLQRAPGQPGLLGEDCDAPLPLLLIGVQHGVLVVHPPQLPSLAAEVEQSLGQGGFARVHMGQDAHGQFFMEMPPLPPRRAGVTQLCLLYPSEPGQASSFPLPHRLSPWR